MATLKKIGKFFLYVFLIFIIIILLIIAGIWGFQKYKHYQAGKELEALPVDSSQSYENILHDHMDETIGDNKLTVKEKLQLNLNPYKLDSSGNGLSDWEAVHEYDLDPTKFSTMDDGISDFVKIQEGLDPHEKIDPNSVEEFTIENEELQAEIHTNNLNAKYFSSIDAYHQDELDSMYKPVRDPVRIRNYDGEALINLPKNAGKDIAAYYFNFEKGEMEKVKKQKRTDNGMMLTVDQDYPIYFIHKSVLDSIGEYYYFRLSLFDFSRAVAGYDHKIFIFKKGLFTDELFKDEKIEDVDYGIIEISRAKISYLYALGLEAIYRTLDVIFKPLDDADQNILARALIDYGKIEGTPEYVQHYVMPWLYEDEEIETENENSKKVVDSGFRLKHHSFRFGNMRTVVGDGGICAGFSRTTEFIYNNSDIETSMKFKPQTWRTKILDKLNSGDYSGLEYDISGNEDDYPFLADGELFDYMFTDGKINYLTEDTFVDSDLTVNPDKLSNPDQSLIKLIETQWMHSNEQKHKNEPNDPSEVTVLDQVEKYLEDGQIIYASLNNGSGGHTVSIYKMEYDRYDPDLIRLYVYDPNLPYQRLTEDFNTREVYMEVHKKVRKISPAVDSYHYFDFDYTPFESHRSSYSYSTDNGYTMMLYHNDEPISGKE